MARGFAASWGAGTQQVLARIYLYNWPHRALGPPCAFSPKQGSYGKWVGVGKERTASESLGEDTCSHGRLVNQSWVRQLGSLEKLPQYFTVTLASTRTHKEPSKERWKTKASENWIFYTR